MTNGAKGRNCELQRAGIAGLRAGVAGLAVLLLAAVLVLLGSCQPPVRDVSAGGRLVVAINPGTARTLLPPIDMNPASYDVAGAGPEGSTFSQSTTNSTLAVSGLPFGQWTVTVSAKNSGGTLIGQGSATTNVDTGLTANVTVVVTPLPGNGTIDLKLTWNPADLLTASVDAQLLPSTGSAIPLSFVMGTGTASYHDAGIAAGYYTLSVKLLDRGYLTMGAVEVVRIVQDQTTSGTFDFSQVNRAIGSIAIGITPVLTDPLTVTINGASPTLAPGSSMTVTATVADYSGNVTYVWYINGESKNTGSNANPSFTVGSTLPAGVYRLDVTAFSTDGMRAGAASSNFTIQ